MFLKVYLKCLQQFGLNTAGESPDHRKTYKPEKKNIKKEMQSQNNTIQIQQKEIENG